MMRRFVLTLGLLAWCAGAAAQASPRGPAELIGGARKARDARDLEQAAERGTSAGSEPVDDENSAGAEAADPHAGMSNGRSPHGGDPHAGLGNEEERTPIATERADPALPPGTIRVRVLEQNGTPAAAAEVALGIMSSDNTHQTRTARTDKDGVALLTGLSSGERQAYRVNVPYQGAKYSSTPFRLPLEGGYQVEIRRLPVTREDRFVVLYLGATSLELKDDRIRVVQEAQLLNLGAQTYVFPEAGTLFPLPKGFMAVQQQESMTDQHVVEAKGEGLRVHGSLPPGQASLLWGFDLPLEGTEARFNFEIPWITFAYRVIADAPPGMTLEVEGMPEPRLHAEGGRRFLVTEVQRKIGEAPFRHLGIALRGIPGPGPLRFVAAGLALGLIFAGAMLARRERGAGQAAPAHGDFEARKAQLLARARELKVQHDQGETGPEYHESQLQALTDELAALLFEQAEQQGSGQQHGKAATEPR
jgi:hypothetical protein